MDQAVAQGRVTPVTFPGRSLPVRWASCRKVRSQGGRCREGHVERKRVTACGLVAVLLSLGVGDTEWRSNMQTAPSMP